MNSSKPIRVTSFDHYIEVEMSGFLEVGSEAYFSELQSLVGLNTGPIGLLYSMSEVQGYAREVAIAHAQRFRELLPALTGIAVVSTTGVVRIGITFVAMLSGAKMKGFDTRAEALEWLESLPRQAIASSI